MIEDLFNMTSQQMGKFSDTVRDEFGHSITSEVFEPLLNDISASGKLENYFRPEPLRLTS